MHHNRHIEHIDFHIEYATLKLCALLMFPNVPIVVKKCIVLNSNKSYFNGNLFNF
jgi:hypothetical protein